MILPRDYMRALQMQQRLNLLGLIQHHEALVLLVPQDLDETRQ